MHRSGAAILRPNPRATFIGGSTTGGLLEVVNSYPSDAFNVFGVAGIVTGGPYGIGLLGYGGNASSGNIGVTGLDIGPGGYGTVGYSTYNPGGNPTLTNETTGVYGISLFGSAVVGQTQANQTSTGPTLAGVAGVDNTNNEGYNDGVLGTTTSGAYGVEGDSSNGAFGGVYGSATTGSGVFGFSQYGIGVAASSFGTNAALYASTNAQGLADAIDAVGYGGFGISASSAAFPGVYGTSLSNDGVQGFTASLGSNGVSGISTQASDASCTPQCSGGDGVLGLTDASTDGSGNLEGGVEGSGYYSVLGVPATSGSYSFAGTDNTGALQTTIDAEGNINTNGEVVSFAGISSVARTSHGLYSKSFGTQAMSHVLEDEHTATIANGSGVVRIDPAFTESVGSADYQVFLTPDGDCNGLYVAAKSATSFVVRELRGGHASLAFDYRIVGHPYGQSAERMSVSSNRADLSKSEAVLGTGHSNARELALAKSTLAQRRMEASAIRDAAALHGSKRPAATKRRFALPSLDLSSLAGR